MAENTLEMYTKDRELLSELLDYTIHNLDEVVDGKVDNPWDLLIESLDTNAKLIEILLRIKQLDTGDNKEWYGMDFEAGMAKALYQVCGTIHTGLSKMSNG